MTIVKKGVDRSARVYGRNVLFTSGTDFVATDVVDIESSLGGAGVTVVVETAAASTCTFKLNSLNRRYPLLPAALLLGFPAPDLQTEKTWLNPDAAEYTMIAGQVLEITDIPVANLEFTALTGTITVSARS